MSDQPRGTIRLVPVASFDVMDGDEQIGRIHTDHNRYEGTASFQALTWTTPSRSQQFASVPEAMAWLVEQYAADHPAVAAWVVSA